MSLELKLFIGLLLHFVGDYLFQSHWMATEKTKRFLPAFTHASIYSLPFLLIAKGIWWFGLYISHYLIDRYRLAIYWIRLKNSTFEGIPPATNNGFDESTPVWLSIMLLIVIDNVIHIIINSLCIYFSHILFI